MYLFMCPPESICSDPHQYTILMQLLAGLQDFAGTSAEWLIQKIIEISVYVFAGKILTAEPHKGAGKTFMSSLFVVFI